MDSREPYQYCYTPTQRGAVNPRHIVPALKRFFGRAFQLSGRASLGEFWWPCLLWVIVSRIVTLPELFDLLDFKTGSFLGVSFSLVGSSLKILLVLCSLYFAIAFFTLTVRRLHDVRESGWIHLFVVIPVLGFFYLLYLLTKTSDRSTNKYGHPETL